MLGVRVVCFWPGLPGAWLRGRVHQLFLALLATWAVCFLLLATYVWPEWIGLATVRTLWFAAAIVWLFSVVFGHWQYGSLVRSHAPEQSAEFVQAQAEYLHGNWFAAEAKLLAILQDEPRDAEAMLLLVSVLRQTRRWRPALRRLNQLELLETAQPWHYEIAREKLLIERAIAGSMGTEADTNDVNETTPELEAVSSVETEAGENSGYDA